MTPREAIEQAFGEFVPTGLPKSINWISKEEQPPTRISGVYVLFTPAHVVYVGKANDIRQRLRMHWKGDWRHVKDQTGASVCYVSCAKPYTIVLENLFIHRIAPTWNGADYAHAHPWAALLFRMPTDPIFVESSIAPSPVHPKALEARFTPHQIAEHARLAASSEVCVWSPAERAAIEQHDAHMEKKRRP